MPFAIAAAWTARPSAAEAPAAEISILDSDLSYPEGMLLHKNMLYVVDIARSHMFVYSTKSFTKTQEIRLDYCGPTSIAPFSVGQVLVTCYLANRLLTLSEAGDFVSSINQTSGGRPIPTPNDSTSDGAGGTFVTSSGDFDLSAPATGAVMHVSAGSQVRVLLDGLHYANGITYDPATRELFVTEHFENRVFVLTLNEKFEMIGKRVFFDLHKLPPPKVHPFAEMGPDNLRLRANGDVVVPQFGGGRFIVVSRSGELKRIVDVPCQFITDTVEFEGNMLFIGAFEFNTGNPRGILGRAHFS